MAPSTASSNLASSITIMAFLPPISAEMCRCIPPHRPSKCSPVSQEPVNDTASMPGCVTRYSPASGPEPWTRFNTPGGMPAAAKISTSLVEIFAAAGIPPGVLNLVHGSGPEAGEYLVTHPGIDAVSFTGSCDTGEHLEGLCGGMHRHISAEMGGKNAI